MLCLALGIGVNTAVFSLLNFIFFRPLPVRAPERLVVLSREKSPLISWPDYREFRDRTQSLEGLAASNPTESSLEFDGETHAAAAEAVTVNYPRVIGVRPFLGRWFEREDEPAAVIGYRAWQRWFHGDPNILGKRVRSETLWYTVVGVAPEEYAGIYLPLNMDIWVPWGAWVKQYPVLAASLENRHRPRVFAFGRLKVGTGIAQAAAELNGINAELREERLTVERVHGVPNARSRQSAAPVAAVLMMVAAVVLLIACANTGNLLLARGAAREREFAVRIALGAGRRRLMRQLLTESLALAVAGGAVGFVLGAWTSRLLQAMMPTTAFGEVFRLDLAPDVRVLLASGALALATTLVFGLAPAWRASQTDPLRGLKGESAAIRFALRRVSLVAQIAMSLVLLLTAGLFLRMLFAFQSSDPAFAVNDRLYVTTLASPPEFTPETGRQFYVRTLERLRAMPGVRNAAVTNLLPLTPVNPDCVTEPGRDSVPATTSTVSAGYLATLQIPLLAGRDFGAEDRPDGRRVAIVNERLARRLWPGESAVGKRFLLGCHETVGFEVIGVARDARMVSLGEAPRPHVFLAFSQNSDGVQNIIVETAGGSEAMLEPVRKAIAAQRGGARIYAVTPLREWVGRSYWMVRWEASLLGVFGGLALALAAVGLYGGIAYHVTLRTHEIGIHMAIGARPRDVLRFVLRDGLRLSLIGVAIGLAMSALIARGMARLLYGVSPTDLLTYVTASLLWLVVALAASYLPARRAARVEPTVALRHD